MTSLKINSLKQTLILSITSGFFGGLLTLLLLGATPLREKVISAEEFRLVDSNGKTKAQFTKSQEGSPALFFFDNDGHSRLEVGLYPDGLPMIILLDEQHRAQGILRLAGGMKAPVLVFKSNGNDRMILGLSMDQPSQDPFGIYYDSNGAKHDIFVKP